MTALFCGQAELTTCQKIQIYCFSIFPLILKLLDIHASRENYHRVPPPHPHPGKNDIGIGRTTCPEQIDQTSQNHFSPPPVLLPRPKRLGIEMILVCLHVCMMRAQVPLPRNYRRREMVMTLVRLHVCVMCVRVFPSTQNLIQANLPKHFMRVMVLFLL